MDEEILHLEIIVNGTWNHYLMDKNPLDVNGFSKIRLV